MCPLYNDCLLINNQYDTNPHPPPPPQLNLYLALFHCREDKPAEEKIVFALSPILIGLTRSENSHSTLAIMNYVGQERSMTRNSILLKQTYRTTLLTVIFLHSFSVYWIFLFFEEVLIVIVCAVNSLEIFIRFRLKRFILKL